MLKKQKKVGCRVCLVILLFMSFSSNITSYSQGDVPTGTLADILARGKILVGADIPYPSFETYNLSTGEPEGFDVDLMWLIADHLSDKYNQPIDVEFVDSEWDPIIINLQASQFDVICSAMTITAARETEVDFTRWYYQAAFSILTAASNPRNIQTTDDINQTDITIGVLAGSATHLWLQQENVDDVATVLTYGALPTAIDALKQGTVDCVLSDEAVISTYATEDDEIMISHSFYADSPEMFGIACRTGDDDLRLALNEALDSLLGPDANNPQPIKSYNAIYKKWFGIDHPLYVSKLPDIIQIGYLVPLTGGLGAYGPKFQQGAELAEWVINTKWGGLPRHGLSINATINLIIEDTATNSYYTEVAATKLITTDGCEVIIGAACSENTLAAAQVTNASQVVLISYASFLPDVASQGGEYTFRVTDDYSLEGWVLADLALTSGKRKAVSLFEDYNSYQDIADVFKEKFEAGGGTVVEELSYSGYSTNFSSQLNTIKALEDSGAIDVIMDVSYYTDGAIIFTEAATKGITTPWVCAKDVARDAIFGKAPGVGSAMKGMWGTKPYKNQTTSEYLQFLAYFAEKYPGETPGFYADYSYDAVMLAVDAIMDADIYNGTMIKESLHTVSQGWKGATGDKSFDINGDVGAIYLIWEVTEPITGTYEFTTRDYWRYHPLNLTLDTSPPTIDSPPDIQYKESTTGHFITWHPTDSHPGNYSLYRNDTLIASSPWNGSSLTFNIDGLSPGIYNYTLVVTDTGGYVVLDHVFVVVVETQQLSTDSSETVSSSTSVGTSGPAPSVSTPGYTIGLLVVLGITFHIIRNRIRQSKKRKRKSSDTAT